MSTSDEQFLKSLRETFRIEAEEHVQAMSACLLKLERSPALEAQRQAISDVFRAAHSLKGAARAVDFVEVESLCQTLEDLFADWKREDAPPPPEALDRVHRSLDAIGAALSVPLSAAPPPQAAPRLPPRVVLPAAPAGGAPPPAWVPPPGPGPGLETQGPAHETVRVAVAKLEGQVLDAEEMLAVKLSANQRADDLRTLAGRFPLWAKEQSGVEPEARTLRQAADMADPAGNLLAGSQGIARLLDFLEWNYEYVKLLESRVAALSAAADEDRQITGRLVDDLLANAKTLLLLPFGTLAVPFAKLVRDLCRDQGKEADLVVHGEDVEIDKRILEEMKAPLIHLLRNAVDHGLEPADERQRLQKLPRATITLAASRVNGHKVLLVVADDGRGIDTARVKASAVEHGVLAADTASQMGDSDSRRLIFETDVSTSAEVTRLSGRGLGLAIVREKAEKLGGAVSVESEPGRGTRFSIIVPSTLATFRGILVDAGQRLFVVPTAHVERVLRPGPGEVRTVEGRDTILVSGRAVSLVRLAEILEMPDPGGEDGSRRPVLVLGTGDQRIAFAVDAVLDEQEVLLKPLRPPLSRVRNVAGATVLGSGQVAPVLNASDLLKSARGAGASARAAVAARPVQAAPKSVLVAEDSITSRMLIKSILESAGYTVKTAVNGMDAFTMLRAEPFDLVVSDVEMPRLDGFGLTARIRADRKMASLPVVLVTGLDKPEDRERGMDAGANAYIVKSKFDQSNLLEAVRRLV